jgi:hypothetical protein
VYRNLKILLENYGSKEPLYFGPPNKKEEWLWYLNLLDHEIHEDGSVSINGNFSMARKNLAVIPFNFRSVHTFDCSDNKLTSLKGAPRYAEKFYCQKNKLTSLEGGPEEVEIVFGCSNNQLTSLEGAPVKVGGSFYCDSNKLESLKGAPKTVGGDFYCQNNKNLTSLEGAPEYIKSRFFSDNFSNEEYREYAKELARRIRIRDKYLKGKLDKEFDIDLGDF